MFGSIKRFYTKNRKKSFFYYEMTSFYLILNMKVYYLLLFLFCFQVFYGQSMAVNMSLRNYNNSYGKNLYFSYKLDNGESYLDSILLKGSEYQFKSLNEYPHLVTIYRDRKLIYSSSDALNFYIDDNVKITKIDLDYSNFENYKIIGGQNQKEFELLNNRLGNINFKEVGEELQKYYALIKESKDSAETMLFQSNIDSLSAEFDNLRQKAFDVKLNFIKEFPNSYVSIYSLQSLLIQREGLEKVDTLQSLYNNFASTIQNSPVGKEISKTLRNYYASNIGAEAPSFSVKDANGQLLNLSSLRGKYVLLDFWASWCAPCIEDFPQLKNFHKTYSHDLVIISISRDENLEKWKNTISKYDLDVWNQVSLKENKGSDLEKKYFVNAIPVKVLIDPEGFIRGKWRGGGQENMNELEELLKQISN